MTEYPMRIQKYLARCGAGPRRKCDIMVIEGRVRINGEPIETPGTLVNEGDQVLLDGKVQSPLKMRYFLLNKPAGYVCVNNDSRGRTWVVDLIPKGRKLGLFSVGRLDLDTTGLIVITNDGEIGNRISHPSSMVTKEYRALIRGHWTKNDLISRLEKGVDLLEGGRVTGIKVIEVIGENEMTRVSITIHEGRKHVVKRIFKAIGSRVIELERTAIGDQRIEGMEIGKWMEIDHHTIRKKILGEI